MLPLTVSEMAAYRGGMCAGKPYSRFRQSGGKRQYDPCIPYAFRVKYGKNGLFCLTERMED